MPGSVPGTIKSDKRDYRHMGGCATSMEEDMTHGKARLQSRVEAYAVFPKRTEIP